YGGIAWVYCNVARDIDRTARVLSGIPGVEAVLTRSEASKRYHLMPSRIGDLVVLGDKDTVFGEMETESEALPAEYRSHGSLYERDVPLFIYNADSFFPHDIRFNLDLARWLYPG